MSGIDVEKVVQENKRLITLILEASYKDHSGAYHSLVAQRIVRRLFGDTEGLKVKASAKGLHLPWIE